MFKNLKILVLALIILFLGCSSKTKKEEEAEQNNTLLILLAASRNSSSGIPCNDVILSSSTSLTYSGTSTTYRVCGNVSTTSTITVSKAGSYKITVVAGSVRYSSSGCSSILESITIETFYNAETTAITTGSTKTFAANDTLKISATRPSSTKYTCSGSSVTQSTVSNYEVLLEAQ